LDIPRQEVSGVLEVLQSGFGAGALARQGLLAIAEEGLHGGASCLDPALEEDKADGVNSHKGENRPESQEIVGGHEAQGEGG